ncbi:MAG: transglycosylase SLT domain-containing protein, partial [Muribaculaceae bacterium]|nr:transglycosylase SLT domain-containing protein [Muribaculaceae bacterium]
IMKYINRILLLTIVLGASAPSRADSVRQISDDTLNGSMTMPQSFETDTKKMLEDWYLKNYTVLDYDADSQPTGDISDEILLERLGTLPTVIEMPLNAPVRNSIRYYASRKQLVENMLGLSLYYMPIFEEALERNGLPLELKYLAVIESALVPTAVSRAGAAGLWQFIPSTASGLGLEVNSLIDQRRDPYLASEAAAKYLKQLYNTYGDWSLAIASYNCGPGNVNKALRRAGEGKHDFWDIYPFLPKETRGYVPGFIAANYIMTYYKNHNISPALARRPIVTDTVHVSRRVHFEQISQVMNIPMEELRALNPQFRKDLIPGDIRPYSLVLPSLQVYAYIANEDSIVNHNATRYARRGIVEPSTGATGRDAKGEYYEEEVIKYHTVRSNETLAKIAKTYGTTVTALRNLNKCGKKVKAGQRLKVKTVQRRYKPTPTPAPEPIVPEVRTDTARTADASPADSIDSATGDVSAAFASEVTQPATETTTVAPKPAPKTEAKPKAKNKTTAPKAVTHTVRKGENLSKIAKRYGITVAQLKKANGLKSDKIDVGDKLKIPAK